MHANEQSGVGAGGAGSGLPARRSPGTRGSRTRLVLVEPAAAGELAPRRDGPHPFGDAGAGAQLANVLCLASVCSSLALRRVAALARNEVAAGGALPRSLDLTCASLAAVTASLLTASGSFLEPARVVLGLLLVLVLPGYALTEACAPSAFARGERALVVVASSIAVVILAGLVLDGTTGGLTTPALSAVLAAVTLAGGAFAVRRRRARLRWARAFSEVAAGACASVEGPR